MIAQQPNHTALPNDATEILVLAGGFGTRLRDLVTDVPKPLAPVCGRPFIYYLMSNWVRQGILRYTFLLHYQASMIEDYLGSLLETGELGDVSFRMITEATPLGTGGAVVNAISELKLSAPFLLANADTWLGLGLKKLVVTHPPAVAVVGVDKADRYGNVVVKGDSVCSFSEKAASRLDSISVNEPMVNAGTYYLHPSIFDAWMGKAFSLEQELLPLLAATGKLRAVPVEGEFIDIGVPEDYKRFCNWVESRQVGVL